MAVGAGSAVAAIALIVFMFSFPSNAINPESDRASVPANNDEVTTPIGTDVIGSIGLADRDSTVMGSNKQPDCLFQIDQSILGRFSGLKKAVERADSETLGYDTFVDVNEGVSSWYGKQEFDNVEASRLVREFNFRLDNLETNSTGYEQSFRFERETYSCDYEYKGSFYTILLSFGTLADIDDNHRGFVPVYVNEDVISSTVDRQPRNEVTVYVPFNNTIVWINQLDSAITVSVNYTDTVDVEQPISTDGIATLTNSNSYAFQKRTIPPNGMLDLDLSPDWSNSADVYRVFSYQIEEYPQLVGKVKVSKQYYVDCLSEVEASSLYGQSNFAVKFPTYLPSGFVSVCNKESSDLWLIEMYSNRTDSGVNIPESFSDLYSKVSNESGIITILAARYPTENWNATAFERFGSMVERGVLPADAQFQLVNGSAMYVYTDKSNGNSVVDVHFGDDVYRIEGKVPKEELVKVALSLTRPVSIALEK